MNIDLTNDPNDDPIDRSMFHEAQRAVEQIRFGVEVANVSGELEKSDLIAYINLRTLEKEDRCIELTVGGYLIVAKKFDSIDSDLKHQNIEAINRYESIDALMLKVSPMYMKKFNNTVAEKLNNLVDCKRGI